MFEPGRLKSGQPLDYAFALRVDYHKGHKRIGHTGSLAGYRAYLGWFPDQDLGVIVLSNLASFPPGKAMQLADLFLPAQPETVKVAKPSAAAIPPPGADKPASPGSAGERVKPSKQPWIFQFTNLTLTGISV